MVKHLAIKLEKDTVVSIVFGTFPMLVVLTDIYAEQWVLQVCSMLISASVVRGISGFKSDRALFAKCNIPHPTKIAATLHMHDLVLVILLFCLAYLT